jgi:DNA-binding NarL/FixJ family response regulator
VRVVIAEDNALLREGLIALLSDHDIEVVAQAGDADCLLRVINGHKPDLAIEARRRHPGVGILILSQYVEPAYTSELLAEGADGVGYLLKERVGEVRTFLAAVKRVAEGGTALDSEVVSTLLRARDPRDGDGELPRCRRASARCWG